jgi:hypothetical protein
LYGADIDVANIGVLGYDSDFKFDQLSQFVSLMKNLLIPLDPTVLAGVTETAVLAATRHEN